jgi:polyisoprenoid-binding protein YceI
MSYAPPKSNPRPRWRHPLVLLGGAILIAAIAVGAYGIWYLFLQGPGPAAVGGSASLAPIPTVVAGTAAASAGVAASPSGTATGSATTGSGTTPTGSAAAPAGSSGTASFDGTWNVDTSIGSFSDFSGSFVGYRVQEQLSGIGANTAVGRTPDVSGTLTIAGDQVTAADITADLTTLQSDDSRRDGQLQRQGIQTDQFPTAEFTLTQPISGTLPAENTEVEVQATGNLTLHGVTKEVTIPLKAKWAGDVIEVAGSTEITFADYNITPPNSFMVLSIADTGTLELQLFFTR